MLSVLGRSSQSFEAPVHTRTALPLEILALRPQLQVLERSRPRRVRLTRMSRGWFDEAHGRVLTGPAARSLQQCSSQFANGVLTIAA